MREPEWFVLRYIVGKETILLKLLNYIKVEFHHLVYKQPVARSKPIDRAWLPGYIFLEFDLHRDNWGQILRMPSALEILGGPSPLPLGLIDDLVARLPSKLAKPSALSCIAPGRRVRIRRGAYQDHEGPVTWSDRRKLKVMLMIFNRPTDVELEFGDVELV